MEFRTLVEMFDKLTALLAAEQRPVLMHRVKGEYRGISYAGLRTMVEEVAGGFAAAGLQRGERIALISENRPEWVVADMAMMHVGAINVSIYPTLTAKQIEFILCDSGASCAVCSSPLQLKKIVSVLPGLPLLRTIVLFAEQPGPFAAAGREGITVISYSRLREMGRTYLAAHPDFLADARSRVQPEDLITLIYTSGTTGDPKGVMLSHANLSSNIRASAECIPFTENDRVLSFLPLSHSYERMAGYYTALACGATIAYAEGIETVRENLLEVRPTVVTTVPRLFERIYNKIIRQVSGARPIRRKIFWWAVSAGISWRKRLRGAARRPAGARLFGVRPDTLWHLARYRVADALVLRKIRAQTGGRIKFFASGGAPLSPHLGEFFDGAGIGILEGYGMTESSPVISVNRLGEQKFGTVGKPIPLVEVSIAPDGEILVRGPNVMKGYWKNERATSEAIDRQGWLHTGDIGTFDEDGYLVITDRKKHLFVSSGGKNIAPQHIENLFVQHELIDQAVVFGDGRMFLTALIVPDFDRLKAVAAQLGVAADSPGRLVEHEGIRRHFEKEIVRLQKDLAGYERVRKFVLLSHPLTVEQGEITPTLKVKRAVVGEKYGGLIEELYRGVE